MYNPMGEYYQIVERDGGYDLLERNSLFLKEPLKLGHYDTKEAAEKSREQWKARDVVADKIEDFTDELIAEYGSVLSDDEIRKMIAETSRA